MFYRTKNKDGFTLVELLVVIAIIGVLIALLLPAVQAAREAARRMSCGNNIKQLSLSLHNYHDIHEAFPPGSMRYRRDVNRFSAHWALLPFVEQGPLYDQFISENTPYPWESSFNTPTMATFCCPSDPNFIEKYENMTSPSCSYFGSQGDWVARSEWDGVANPRGLFSLQGSANTLQTTSMASVSDGTSNTIAFAEAVIGADPRLRVKGGLVQHLGDDLMAHDANPSDATDGFKAEKCWSVFEGQRYAVGTDVNEGIGRRFGDSAPLFSYFSTVYPPNGPSCARRGNGDHTEEMAISATSNHPGGVQAGLCDGSCRFISETINSLSSGVTYASTTVYVSEGGASNYGVWGALGSVGGGETSSGL